VAATPAVAILEEGLEATMVEGMTVGVITVATMGAQEHASKSL
jgi:hypothetical protein